MQRSFLLAKKSGENAAKFIINLHPKYFQNNIAEPDIPVSRGNCDFQMTLYKCKLSQAFVANT